MNRHRVLHGPLSAISSRKREREEILKNEILVFAARVRPEISNGRDVDFHRDLSAKMWKMGLSEVKKFRGRIVGGKEDGLFPVSRIVEKKGGAAAFTAGFLGEEYVDRMLMVARSGGDVQSVMAGKEYLAWAAEHGPSQVKTRALAGIAKVAADEVLDGNGNFIEREMIKKRGIMSALSRELGEGEAWKITRGVLSMEKAGFGIRIGLSFLGGACTAASFFALQGGISAPGALAAMAFSAVVGAFAGFAFLSRTNLELLQIKIRKLMEKRGETNALAQERRLPEEKMDS